MIQFVCLLDLKSLTIASGVTLSTDANCLWLAMGISGALTLNGTISANKNPASAAATYYMNEPNASGSLSGTALSYSITQAAGGRGGNGGDARHFKCSTGTGFGGVSAVSLFGNASGGGYRRIRVRIYVL
jgi:hypothetical protein